MQQILNAKQHILGSKSIAAISGVGGDDLEDFEKELEDLMMDDTIAGMFKCSVACVFNNLKTTLLIVSIYFSSLCQNLYSHFEFSCKLRMEQGSILMLNNLFNSGTWWKPTVIENPVVSVANTCFLCIC